MTPNTPPGGRWVELADGVLVRRYIELDLSIGLVVGQRRCLVVDTRSNPEQGAELLAAVREVTDLPCTVVITHAHFDHCLGTEAFLPAPVWAHPRCREDLERGGAAQHAEALSWARAAGLHPEPPPVRPVLPGWLVHAPTEVDLGGHRVLLLHPGRGHTDHDVVVWSERTRVLFAGDLVEQGADPDFADAWPLEWPASVAALLDLGPETVVPGHGDPVDARFVAAEGDRLAALAAVCRQVWSGALDAPGALATSPFTHRTTLAALSRANPGNLTGALARPQ